MMERILGSIRTRRSPLSWRDPGLPGIARTTRPAQSLAVHALPRGIFAFVSSPNRTLRRARRAGRNRLSVLAGLVLLSMLAGAALAAAGTSTPVSIPEKPEWVPGYTLFVLPGETITLDTDLPGGAAYRWSGAGRFLVPKSVKVRAATSGRMGPVLPAGSPITWQAPAEVGGGVLTLRVAGAEGWENALSVPVQVLAPFERIVAGRLDGYRIGRYPLTKRIPDKPESDYSPPPGFVRLPETGDRVAVSPRFFANDFVCKQRHSGGDKYVAVDPKLLRFLEAITDRVEAEGFRCAAGPSVGHAQIELASFTPATRVAPEAPGRPILVMSGYRTPAYNRSLGNVKMSRHQYGDAADILIDADGDQVMDDLNRDGRLDGQDAIQLAEWIEELWQRPEFAVRPGGLGVYNSGGDHGPFVHVDVRGWRARWGGNGLKWEGAEAGSEDLALPAPDGDEPAAAPARKIVLAR
jgi:hypothetical protein